MILGNICVAIISFPVFDVINFEINLAFLYYITKKVMIENKIS